MDSNQVSVVALQSQKSHNVLSIQIDIPLEDVPEAAYSLLSNNSFQYLLQNITRAAVDFSQSNIKDHL